MLTLSKKIDLISRHSVILELELGLTICSSAYAHLWKLVLLEPRSLQNYPVLRSLVSKGDPSEIFLFNDLHAAILRLDLSRTFKSQLASTHRDFVDQPDCMGRTALSWAAELGDLDKIRMLLTKGADLNKQDHSGRTPLWHCTYNTDCLTLLLESGAQVDSSDLLGFKKSINVVRAQDDIDCAEILWKFGANIKHQYGNGFVINYAVERFRPHLLHWMLRKEVDTEVRDSIGETALLHLTSTSSHAETWKILLRGKPDYKAIDVFSEGLLHKMARFGSFEHMEILKQQSDFSDFDVERKSACAIRQYQQDKVGKTALELARWRRDCQSEWAEDSIMQLDPDPEAWYAAFESWIKSIKAAYDAKRSNHKVAISGTASQGIPAITEESCSDQDMNMNLEIWPSVPGSYPREDGEHN